MKGKGLVCFQCLTNRHKKLISQLTNPHPIGFRAEVHRSFKKLASELDDSAIQLNTVVSHIEETSEGVRITSKDEFWEAQYVVSTLPPNLFVNNIQCSPSLPEEFIGLSKQTHTWMGESIKFGVFICTAILARKGPLWCIF